MAKGKTDARTPIGLKYIQKLIYELNTTQERGVT